MKRLIALALAAFVLTGCTKDTIIVSESGTVNVGVVTSETVLTRVASTVDGNTYKLGVHPLGTVGPMFASGWADFLDNMTSRDLSVTLETVVMYKGTKNSASQLIDVTTLTCPKGLMFSGCVSQIEATQKGIYLLYKEKFSYIKE